MAKKILTMDLVRQICDEIWASGHEPTYDAVVARAGGGSYSTLKPMLQQCLEEGPVAREPMPQPLEHQIAAISRAVWARALRAADAALTARRGEVEVEVDRAKVQLQQQVDLCDALERQLAAEREVQDRLRAQLASLQHRIDTMASLETRLSDSEAMCRQLLSENERLRLESEKSRAEALAYRDILKLTASRHVEHSAGRSEGRDEEVGSASGE